MTILHIKIVPVLTILLLSPALALAENRPESIFSAGQQFYETGNYEQALDAFLQGVALEPGNSVYHHWLGKCYGRLAEKAGILRAYKLSKKTRIHLERAVELDDTNIAALTDLMTFYRQAPGFLGGGKDKADAISRRIQELQANAIPDAEECSPVDSKNAD